MGKRYGRNQKRKHLEEIARWKAAHEMSNGLLHHTSKKLQEANATIAEMIEVVESVARHSVVTPPKRIKCSYESDHFRVAKLNRTTSFTGIKAGDECCSDCFETVDVYALESFVRRHAEQFKVAVHLEYSAGGRSVYMISEEALHTIPENELARRIVPTICREMIKHIRRR